MNNVDLTEEKKARFRHVEEQAEKTARDIYRTVMEGGSPGGLLVVYGPKNSGKTLVAVKVCQLLGQTMKVTCSQPRVDRPDVELGYLYSRIGEKIKADSFINEAEIKQLFTNTGLIMVDDMMFIPYELQGFFVRELEAFVSKGGWFLGMGILNSARKTQFLLTSLLKEKALKAYKLTAVCLKCGTTKAEVGQRIIDGKEAGTGTEEYMPPTAHVSYEPRCWECFKEV